MAMSMDTEELEELQEISSSQPGTHSAMRAKEKHPETGPPPPLPSGAAGRCCRWTAVCLGLLTALLLIMCIRVVLTQRIMKERDQLLSNHNNLLEERDQMLTNQSNLLKERDQLLRYKHCIEERPSCPTGWEVFRCYCYHSDARYRSWSDSREYCQSHGGDLVIIKTPEKQRFISEKKYSGWIGLRKEEGEPSRWIDDTPVSTWYWHPTQPSTATADCVAIYNSGATDQNWYDYACTTVQGSICEKPAFTHN